MINRILRYLVLLSLLMVLAACEEMVSDVDVPETQPKLVVNSFITPDSPYTSICVYKSRPLYSSYDNDTTKFPVVKDATITISNADTSVNIPYDVEYDIYRISKSDFPIIAGNTYTLNVTTPSGYSVNAICTVPIVLPPQIENITIDSSLEYELYKCHANFRFLDIEGTEQYYCVTASKVSYQTGDFDPYIDELRFNRGDSYFSNKNKEGQYFSFVTDDYYTYQEEPVKLIFTIAVIDKNYYYYHKGLSDSDEGNPFAEPTPLFSNINGGLGIFAAYIQNEIVIDL